MTRASLFALPLVVACIGQTACATASSPAAGRRGTPAAVADAAVHDAAAHSRGTGPDDTAAAPIPSTVGQLGFAFDAADLDDRARAQLNQVADLLLAEPELELALEGHCDDRGTSMYNLALGDRRARAAASYLAALGVDEGRIHVISFGEEMPLVAHASTEEEHAQNRRGEMTFFKAGGASAQAEPTFLRYAVRWGG